MDIDVENVVVRDNGLLVGISEKLLTSKHRDVHCGVSGDWGGFDNIELWIHEFTELSLFKLIGLYYIAIDNGKEDVQMSLAHALTSLHTKSGIWATVDKYILKCNMVDSEIFARILFGLRKVK